MKVKLKHIQNFLSKYLLKLSIIYHFHQSYFKISLSEEMFFNKIMLIEMLKDLVNMRFSEEESKIALIITKKHKH